MHSRRIPSTCKRRGKVAQRKLLLLLARILPFYIAYSFLGPHARPRVFRAATHVVFLISIIIVSARARFIWSVTNSALMDLELIAQRGYSPPLLRPVRLLPNSSHSPFSLLFHLSREVCPSMEAPSAAGSPAALAIFQQYVPPVTARLSALLNLTLADSEAIPSICFSQILTNVL